MTKQQLIYSLIVLLVGSAIGYFTATSIRNKRNEKAELQLIEANRIIDSVMVANKEQKRFFDMELKQIRALITDSRVNLELRENDFKNDTTVISYNELIQRARAITGSNR